MSEKLKTPTYTRNAIKNYEKNLVRKVINFDTRKDEDKQLLDLLEKDERSFSEIVRLALKKELGILI